MTLRDTTPRMNAAQLEAFLDEVFPQLHSGGRTYFVEEVGPMTARMRCDYHEKHLRPGGTISGPTMMALADLALYAAILARSARSRSPSPRACPSTSCASRRPQP